MSVLKKYKGKRITPKDKNWSKGTWYLWRRINGRPVHKSLKDAKTKEQAEAAERKIIEKAFNQRYGIADTVTTFKEFADGPYTEYVKQKNVNQTAKIQYIGLLKDFFKSQTLTGITPQDCRNCQAAMQKKGYSASSVNLIMSTASKLFTIAGQEGILERNPMQYVQRLKDPPPRSRLLTEKEKERLWEELAKDLLMLRLVTLAMNLPLRRGQLLAVTPDAIDNQRGLLFVIQSKGRGPRTVPLNTTALNILRSMAQDNQLPFPLKDFRKRWKRALVAAGINKKGGKRGENFTFHDLRHEMATNLVRNNVNPEIIRQLYGHSAMKITQVYMNPEFEQMSAAMNTLDKPKNSTSATELQPSEDWPDDIN